MPLSALLLMVTGGIAAIAILLHILGMSRPRIFADDTEIAAVWRNEYPDTNLQSVNLSRNRHFALVQSSAGLGVVWAMGADGAARLLLGAEVSDIPGGLELSLPDYTAPEIRLKLDPDEIDSWRSKMEASL
ncbi:hypothetical protein E7681_05730 [Thalassobius vesicularis]|uniref:Uncharacterized protein n=1 Tax=Thalassobius vesicularis TaxID=1294297 RepID=A0A4S3MBE9_9RHOB|nr:hypothetical protein [Thalassobius vesicularis]THD75945.1 hypothetical protein E7681_05730 [Thalassobius vesicularis]